MHNEVLVEKKINARDNEAKQMVIEMLIEEGYGTYARRLQFYKFKVADFFLGHYIAVAAMFPDLDTIVVNSGFLDDEVTFKQLSLVVRHELLHFLLMHEKRLFDHLKAVDPKFEETYRRASIHELANIAMDWDLSREGYDEHDKKVAKALALNGRVLGGLVLEEDKPEWLDKPMEEMFDLLRKEHEENLKNSPQQQQGPVEVNIKKTSHSPEYVKAYNDAIGAFDNASNQEIIAAIEKLSKGEDL